MRFCLSGRIYENAGKMAIGIEEFFQTAKEKKCDCVELRQTQINPWSAPKDIEEINDLSEKYSLPVEMITMRKSKLNEEKDYALFIEYLSLAKALKCRQIKVGGNNYKLLRQAAEEAERYGIMIGSNNHIGTITETKAGTVEYLNKINHPNFKLLLDPSHLWINNDPADKAFMETVKDKISYLVVQDYAEGIGAGFERIGKRSVRPGNENEAGAVGYKKIMETLKEIGCDVPCGLVQPSALYFCK
jgi:sugar phosphate isomerase/epimerase